MSDDAERIRRGILAIARDHAASGSALPGEHELARRLDANRPQVRRVLAVLEQQGIVRRHQGAATTIDPVSLRMTVRLEEQLEHSTLLERLGYVPAVELVEAGPVDELSPRIRDELATTTDARAVRAVKRWLADGRPAMVAENVLLLPDGFDGEIDAAASIFDTIEAVWNQPVVWELAAPGVESLGAEDAALLDMDEGAACMTFSIIGVLREGTRVFHAFERHNPTIVQYSVVRRFPEPWA